MSHFERIPAAVAAEVRSALAPGESVVWIGQPRGTPPVIARLVAIVVGTAAGLKGVYILSLELGAVSVILGLVVLASWVIGLWALFAWERRVLGRTCYVITDRRAIAFVPHWRGGYRVFVNQPEDIANARRASFRSGYGSIYWVEPISSPFSWMLGRWRGGFMSIDNMGEVQELMHRTFLPLLRARLEDPDPEVRRKAAKSFTVLGATATEALPSLLDALDSEDSVVRRHVASALGRLGEKGTSAIPALRRTMLIDEDRNVATAAQNAISEIQAAVAT